MPYGNQYRPFFLKAKELYLKQTLPRVTVGKKSPGYHG
jgi:hypothetical protein